MIYLFTALYCEAELLIKEFHLEKNLENTRFQEFYQEEAGIRLAITGVGEIAAATAVSSICTAYKPKEGDLLLNIGTCAHLAGKKGVYVCNKITEQATGRTFYPDLLYRHGLPEEAVVTGMLPYHQGESERMGMQLCRQRESGMVKITSCHREKSLASEMLLYHKDESVLSGMTSGNKKNGIMPEVSLPGGNPCNFSNKISAGNDRGFLYDMEAAAIYQAGSYFWAPHQMLFVKIVSDGGTAQAVSREDVGKLMKQYQDILCGFIEGLSAFQRENMPLENPVQQEEMWAETLCGDLHCSKVMADSLKQHLHYWELAGLDYSSAIQRMYREGLLPCKEKREGKLRFEELKRRLF